MSETNTVSPLRQRMIEDMAARKLNPHTQRGYINSCKRFAAWLKRSPDTATPDEVRLFQLHLIESGTNICCNTGIVAVWWQSQRRMKAAFDSGGWQNCAAYVAGDIGGNSSGESRTASNIFQRSSGPSTKPPLPTTTSVTACTLGCIRKTAQRRLVGLGVVTSFAKSVGRCVMGLERSQGGLEPLG